MMISKEMVEMIKNMPRPIMVEIFTNVLKQNCNEAGLFGDELIEYISAMREITIEAMDNIAEGK